MERKAFIMKLKPGYEMEYQKRHDEIWPELEQLLTDSGIRNYSIFLDRETLTLFGVQELEDGANDEGLSTNPLMRKWWDYMADIMETNPDNSPVAIPLREVFHMD